MGFRRSREERQKKEDGNIRRKVDKDRKDKQGEREIMKE
jgi:hypothetical protein